MSRSLSCYFLSLIALNLVVAEDWPKLHRPARSLGEGEWRRGDSNPRPVMFQDKALHA